MLSYFSQYIFSILELSIIYALKGHLNEGLWIRMRNSDLTAGFLIPLPVCRNSVHSLLEAMRDLLGNIHVAEVPAEAGDEASEDEVQPG